jgi:hypothetical protein
MVFARRKVCRVETCKRVRTGNVGFCRPLVAFSLYRIRDSGAGSTFAETADR